VLGTGLGLGAELGTGLGLGAELGMEDGSELGSPLVEGPGLPVGAAAGAGEGTLQAESTRSPARERLKAAWRGRARERAFGMAAGRARRDIGSRRMVPRDTLRPFPPDGMARRAGSVGVFIIREMVGTSPRSWSDAARQAVATASRTVRNIREIEVVKSSATVVDGQIAEYRVELKIHFEYEGGEG